jgi:hypothetical protein
MGIYDGVSHPVVHHSRVSFVVETVKELKEFHIILSQAANLQQPIAEGVCKDSALQAK